jgi:hypothetical protein
MEAVTGKQANTKNADKKTIETTQELISLYKREFGNNWQNVFSATVRIDLT